jgi:hypothetical protein
MGRLKSGYGALKTRHRFYSGSILKNPEVHTPKTKFSQRALNQIKQPATIVGVVAGVGISSVISYAVDSFLVKGLSIKLLPSIPILLPSGYKWDIIKAESNVLKRSAIAGVIGSAPAGIIAGVIYWGAKDNQLQKNVAIGLGLGAGISLIGWIIKGVVQYSVAEVTETITPKPKPKDKNTDIGPVINKVIFPWS